MTDQEIKAEADKIKEMFCDVVQPMTYYGTEAKIKAKELSIIHVKGIIESRPLEPVPDGLYYELTQDRVDVAIEHWQSILTELERK